MTSNPRERPFRLRRRTIGLLVLLGAVQSAALIGFVLLLRSHIDDISDPLGARLSVATLIGLVVVSLVLALTHGLEFRVSESVGYDVVQRARLELYDHLAQLAPRSVLQSSRGALLLRFSGDLSTLRTWISRGLARGIVSGLTVVTIVIIVLFLNVRVGLVAIGVLLIGSSASALLGYRVRRTVRAVRWRRSLVISNIAEQISSLASVQLFGRSGGERSRFAAQNESLTQALHRMVRTRARLRVISSATASGALVGAIAIGSHEVVRGRATVGTVVGAIVALRFASTPLRALGQSHEYWQAAQVSRRKLRDFLERPSQTDPEECPSLIVGSGEIVVRGLTIKGALDSVDLTAHGGRMLAIVGPNGAGKSTLLNAIVRLAIPDQGEVLIDGQPIADRRRLSLYRHVGMLSPDLPLLRGTIRRNVLYRFRDADSDEIERVFLACRLDEIVGDQQEMMSTWLVEGGTNLSPGHRQRIALARAILGNPRILLLDEPTANLDDASKEVVRRALIRYRGTVILVTHDPEEAALADQVCVMKAGRVVESMSGEDYRERWRVTRLVAAGRVQW